LRRQLRPTAVDQFIARCHAPIAASIQIATVTSVAARTISRNPVAP